MRHLPEGWRETAEDWMRDLYDEGYWEQGIGSNYRSYGDDGGWRPTLDAMMQSKLIRPGDEVLEIACAKGWFVYHGREAGLEMHGVDISEWAIQYCCRPVTEWLKVGDAANLPYGDATFDAICHWEFLEHVPEEHLDQVLGEMERVSRPGATMFARIALEGSEQAEHDADCTHFTMKPREWWEQRLGHRGWLQLPVAEDLLDEQFEGRDWAGRFFVYMIGGWPDVEVNP